MVFKCDQVVRKRTKGFGVSLCTTQKWGDGGVLQTPEPRKTDMSDILNRFICPCVQCLIVNIKWGDYDVFSVLIPYINAILFIANK